MEPHRLDAFNLHCFHATSTPDHRILPIMSISPILERLQEPEVLRTIQTALPICLAGIAGRFPSIYESHPLLTLTGIATCLHSWVIPIIRLTGPAKDKINQFRLIVTLGNRYLLTSGRIMGMTLLGTTFLLYSHPDAAVAKLWRYYAVAAGILLPVAPWEAFLIFPTNDKILAMGDRFGKESKGVASKDQSGSDKELRELITSWQRWHVGRILMPLGAAVVTAIGLLNT